ncbi:ubiquitin C-terminal hydrolase 13-like [Phragmites australis]|uniref:ubiquitin C-terminal hydrolase 13-like n=1 Tax=Phragmites australis TaxID=29695 RepID=UPI002D791C09|nr:ubiquitin C-terminal hydrolase 13-like [Phragmites australis]
MADISNIASSLLPFGQGETVEGELVAGITEEVVVFVRHISTWPETWLDFPFSLASATPMHIQYFREPFFFLSRDGEALSDIKVRIQRRLQVPDVQFLKYLQDSDIVLSRFQKKIYGGWEHHLGLELTATAPKRSCLASQILP